MNVLLIDDDIELTASLTSFLQLNEIQATSARSTQIAEAKVQTQEYDAILLDVMLPGQSGFEFLPVLRLLTNSPILMLTAMGEEEQRVRGLELGADDYITKPFSAKELVARLRALARRSQRQSTQAITHDDLRLYPTQLRAEVGNKTIDLTAAESEILLALITAPNHTVSREKLSHQVLGRANSPMDRSLDVHVSNLRKKLGPHPTRGNRIRSIRGKGYLLAI